LIKQSLFLAAAAQAQTRPSQQQRQQQAAAAVVPHLELCLASVQQCNLRSYSCQPFTEYHLGRSFCLTALCPGQSHPRNSHAHCLNTQPGCLRGRVYCAPLHSSLQPPAHFVGAFVNEGEHSGVQSRMLTVCVACCVLPASRCTCLSLSALVSRSGCRLRASTLQACGHSSSCWMSTSTCVLMQLHSCPVCAATLVCSGGRCCKLLLLAAAHRMAEGTQQLSVA
jgi:hypothetical protein